MFLYHGTSTKYISAILKEGILPRRKTNLESNREGNLESKPDFVYLSTAYPAFYALSATSKFEEETDLLILKVEVEENVLFPDEDFIARMERKKSDKEAYVKSLNPQINPAKYKELWRDCLKNTGTVCTPEISPENIIDYKIIPNSNWKLIMNIG